MKAIAVLLAAVSLCSMERAPAQTPAVAPPKDAQVKPPEKGEAPVPAAPVREWNNADDKSEEIDVSSPPGGAAFVQLGRSGRAYRLLHQDVRQGIYHVVVPPHARLQMWAQKDLAEQKDHPFADAARWGAYPIITLGPFTAGPADRPGPPAWLDASWQSAPGRFRAYPGGALVVQFLVTNQSRKPWRNPRVRLFAPEDWTLNHETAPLTSAAVYTSKSGTPNVRYGTERLMPGSSGVAVFTVTLPKRAVMGQTLPLVAFLRFEGVGRTITITNSVDVTTEEPVERRYAMNEKGTRFAVRLLNRFAPAGIGEALVEVKEPAGVAWGVKPPAPVKVEEDVDALATVAAEPSPDGPTAVPVVVTLNGVRMGATPLVDVWTELHADGSAVEKGLTRIAPAEATGGTASLDFAVASGFAVSDPEKYVSPSWVTVTLENHGAKQLRMEDDAYGSNAPTVAGDVPLQQGIGPQTVSFLLPDARFEKSLPNKADFQLSWSGGAATITRVELSKWNPQYGVGKG